MQQTTKILIAGSQREDVAVISALLNQQPGYKVITRTLSAHELPAVLAEQPDALVFVLSADPRAELQALHNRPPAKRPPTILVGQDSDAQILRQAMRAGARDFFPLSMAAGELPAAIARIVNEKALEAATARFTAVINARGGAGSSFIAANLAHVLTAQGALRVALVDQDMQFGTLPLYFDMQPNGGLLKAVANVEMLDTPALEAHMLKHPSGLHVLGTAADHLVLPGEVPDKKFQALLRLLGRSYEQVVLDLPRQIDALTAAAIQQADRIAVVVQQSLPHLREAKRIIDLLRREFEVPAERIVIVVNRWDKRSSVTWGDIKQTLPDYALLPVRNDYARVAESANLGVPILSAAANSPVTADLQRVAEILGGVEVARPKGLLARLFS